jgi:hypothetical protein
MTAALGKPCDPAALLAGVWRRAALLGLLASVACASAPGAATAPPPRLEQTEGTVLFEIGNLGPAQRTELAGNRERIWDALVDAYTSLGIPANLADPAAFRYGVERYTGGQVAGRRAADFFRCGFEGTGPSSVGGYRTELTVISTLRPLANGNTSLDIEAGGSARRVEGTSTPRVRCESTGELEKRIVAAVRERLTP